jgi:hypothetical protein
MARLQYFSSRHGLFGFPTPTRIPVECEGACRSLSMRVRTMIVSRPVPIGLGLWRQGHVGPPGKLELRNEVGRS